MKLKELQNHRMVNLAQLTMQEWFADNTPRHAAALAYYTIFALAPLLTIVFSIAGAIYGYDVAETNIIAQVKSFINNPGVADLIKTVLANSVATSSNPFLTVLSVAVLIYGATSVFSELQSALNTIWDAPVKNNLRFSDILLNRLFAVLMVFIGGLILFASLIFTTFIAAANQWADTYLHFTIYSEWIVFFSLFGISTLIFALIYKYVPDLQIAWHDVLIGAITTGLLFTVARTVINLSLRYTSIASIFGATGSLVVLLVWIYYSAMIFFLGAEFTQVYSRTYGSRWREQQLLEEATLEETSHTIETEEGVIVKKDAAEILAESVVESVVAQAENRETELSDADDERLMDEIEAEDEQSSQSDEVPPLEESQPVRGQRIKALRKQLGQGVSRGVNQGIRKVQEGSKALRKVPNAIGSPIGDIAIGVAVVGAISIAGFLFEPWRRKQEDKKRIIEPLEQ